MKNIFIALGETAWHRTQHFQLESGYKTDDQLPIYEYISLLPTDEAGKVTIDGFDASHLNRNTLFLAPFDIRTALVALQKNPWLGELRRYIEHCKAYLEKRDQLGEQFIPKLLYRLHGLEPIQELMLSIERSINSQNINSTSSQTIIHVFADLSNPMIAACFADVIVQIRHLYAPPYYSLQLYVDLPNGEDQLIAAQAFATMQSLALLKEKQWQPENILGPLPIETPSSWFDQCTLLDQHEYRQMDHEEYFTKKLLHPLTAQLLRKSYGYEQLLLKESPSECYTHSVLDIFLNRRSLSDDVAELTLHNLLHYAKDWQYSEKTQFTENYQIFCDERWFLDDQYLLGHVETPLKIGRLARKWEDVVHDWKNHREKWLEELNEVGAKERAQTLRSWYADFFQNRFRLIGVKNFYDELHESMHLMANQVAHKIEVDLLTQWRSKAPLSMMPQAITGILKFIDEKIAFFNQGLAQISQEVFDAQAEIKSVLANESQLVINNARWLAHPTWRRLDGALYYFYLGQTRQISYAFAIDYLKTLQLAIKKLAGNAEEMIMSFQALHQKVDKKMNATASTRANNILHENDDFGISVVSQAPVKDSLPKDFLNSLLHPAFIHSLSQQFDGNMSALDTLADLGDFLQSKQGFDFLDELGDQIKAEAQFRLDSQKVRQSSDLAEVLKLEHLAILNEGIGFFCQKMDNTPEWQRARKDAFLSDSMYYFLEHEKIMSKLFPMGFGYNHKVLTEKLSNKFTVIVSQNIQLEHFSPIEKLYVGYQKVVEQFGFEMSMFMLQGAFHQQNWFAILNPSNAAQLSSEQKRQIVLSCLLFDLVTTEENGYKLIFTNQMHFSVGTKWFDMVSNVHNDTLWLVLLERIQDKMRSLGADLAAEYPRLKLALQNYISEIKSIAEVSSDDVQAQYAQASFYLPWARAAKSVIQQIESNIKKQ